MSLTEQTCEISEKELVILKTVVRNLHIALKNSVFYASDHPIYVYSINNLKAAFEKWFQIRDKFEIGISQDDIFFDGNPLREKQSFYSEVANYLHIRGVSLLSISKGIELEELTNFFNLMKHDRRTIKEKGGLRDNLTTNGHLQIKELDYSTILTSTTKSVTSEEEKVWQSLFSIAEETKEGKLPDSKMEFLVKFFSDAEKSAKTLNKVYKEAVAQLQDEETVKNIRDSVTKICQYFEKNKKADTKELKVKLMNVIAQLHPDLISMLFEQTSSNENSYDLAEEITKDFSEGYIAEFIESLISNEDTFNENLLKVFDKLAPDAKKDDNVVMMVADRLFSKRIMNPNTLSKLQMSIMEIFKKHPDSNFMNQIYKITVDAVINKKIDTLVYVAKLSPLINKFVQSVEEEQLKKEKIWLLLNILWLENDSSEFKKFTEKVVSILPEVLDSKDTLRLKDIIEFYTEKTRSEQKKNKNIAKEIKEGIQKLTNSETIDGIISLIPEASKDDLENIAYILERTTSNSAKSLVDAFIEEKNPAHRNKFIFIFLKLRKKISNEVVDRLEYCEPSTVKDLFVILNRCDSVKAQLVSKKLINHKNPQIRFIALEEFKPKNEEEMKLVLNIFKKEKNKSVKRKATTVLLKTGNSDIIIKLFRQTERSLFGRKFLVQLVELCGHLRVPESFIHLKRIFLKRVFFNTKRRDELRIATVTSLARLQTTEAMELVKTGLKDKSKRVRETSEIITKLDE